MFERCNKRLKQNNLLINNVCVQFAQSCYVIVPETAGRSIMCSISWRRSTMHDVYQTENRKWRKRIRRALVSAISSVSSTQKVGRGNFWANINVGTESQGACKE